MATASLAVLPTPITISSRNSPQLPKAKITEQGDRLTGDAAALAYPIADIALAMMGRQLVDTCATLQLAGGGAEDTHVKGATRRTILRAAGKPLQRAHPGK